MADLAAGDVTITVEERSIQGNKKRNRVKITFGDGALTYPSGGVPLPAIGKFGMMRSLDYLLLSDDDDSKGTIWKYDKENRKLRAYVQGATVGAAGAQTLDDFPVTAGFGVTADTHLSLKAGSATVRIGDLKEAVAATDAPPATVLYAEAVGW